MVLTSTLLVLATAAAVTAAAHAIGLEWGPAWVLGAALAPTDATAVGVLARRLPRRTVTVLRAESLVNDGTALVIYGLAVGVTVGEEQLTPLHVSGLPLVAYGGGLLTGALVVLVSWQVRRRMDDPMLENIAMLVTPFAAFLLAESIHASGVLAVVVCGLFMSQVTPRITGALTRQTSVPFWTVSTTVLSSVLFVLVGLQAQTAVRDLSSVSLVQALLDILLITAVVVGVRWVWLYTTPYIIRALDRRPAQRLRRQGARQRSVSGVAGFRGAVSLAAVLAVPHTLDSGAPFPDRDLIAVITCVVQRVRTEIEKRRKVLAADGAEGDPAIRHDDQYTSLWLALIARKREALLELRDEQRIDDIVLRQVQAMLDVEEVRFSRTDPVD